jgi:NADH:ubiquinone oxidoreductase subunit 4 (subunit M)
VRGWAGLIATFLPLLVTIAACGAVKGKKLWAFSLFVHLLSWFCFFFLAASFYSPAEYAGSVISPAILARSSWSNFTGLRWVFHSSMMALAVSSVTVCYHFLAHSMLEKSRASVASLSAYLTCVLGALGADHLLLFSVFFAGALLPRFIFSGVDAKENHIEPVREAAFLSTIASLSLLLCVLAFSEEFRATIGDWFHLSGDTYMVLPGAIGFSLLLLAVGIGAGIFPFHGSTRRIFEMESVEKAVPLSLQPLLGFTLLSRFVVELFPGELIRFGHYLLAFFSVGALYCALNFLGARNARDRVFWLQQAICSFIAIGLFNLNPKGWHGSLILLFFQTLSVPFMLFVLACHERRTVPLPLQRIREFPAFALSTAAAALFALFLPVSVGFYGVLFVIWSLSGAHGWPLPLVTLSIPVIAFAGMRIMFFRLEGETASDTKGEFHDLVWEEILAIAPLGLVLLIFGVLPSLLLGPMGVSIATLLKGLNGN